MGAECHHILEKKAQQNKKPTQWVILSVIKKLLHYTYVKT